MKKRCLISLLILSFSIFSYSQITNDISQVPRISKGIIKLTDNSIWSFRNLRVLNDTVLFTNKSYGNCSYSATDISSISKSKSNFLSGALLGGCGGLAASVGGYLAMTPEEREGVNPFIVGAGVTGVFILAGGIVGIFIKTYKPIYNSSSSYYFQPGLGIQHNGTPYLQLTLKLPIN